MATLQSYIDKLPPAFKARYTTSVHFITWANQLLEELEGRGFLSSYLREVGAVVHNLSWILKPSDMVALQEVFNPQDKRQQFRIEDVNDKLKLLDVTLDHDITDDESITTLSAQAVGSITGNIVGHAADDLENYLFYITAGTLAGNGIVLVGNDVSGATTTKLNFLHDRSAALTAGQATAARLVSPDFYVMLKYESLITAISSASEELPIPDYCEARLVPVWLRWCCEREAMAVSKDTRYWEQEKEKELFSVQAKQSARINPAKGRRLAGFEKASQIQKPHPDYSEFV